MCIGGFLIHYCSIFCRVAWSLMLEDIVLEVITDWRIRSIANEQI